MGWTARYDICYYEKKKVHNFFIITLLADFIYTYYICIHVTSTFYLRPNEKVTWILISTSLHWPGSHIPMRTPTYTDTLLYQSLPKPALRRVPEALSSVFYQTLGTECQIKYTRKKKHSIKCVFVGCLFSGTRQICILPSAISRHTAKCDFAECLFSGTRQRCILPSVFVLALGKEAFCHVHFFWPSANQFFKAIFEALNEFKWKTFQLQSCITSQDLQSLFWSFLHFTKR